MAKFEINARFTKYYQIKINLNILVFQIKHHFKFIEKFMNSSRTV